MASILDTIEVCVTCYNVTKQKKEPTLIRESKLILPQRTCPNCKSSWKPITVSRSLEDDMWYDIRPKPLNSDHRLCTAILKGNTCIRGPRCIRPHNKLEKHAWDAEQYSNYQMKKAENKDKYQCFICRVKCPDEQSLNQHMLGKQHGQRASKMRLLPSTGSSLHYSKPIRARPTLQRRVTSYALCNNVLRFKSCRLKNGCSFAHSEEELTAWMQALKEEQRSMREKQDYKPQASYEVDLESPTEQMTPTEDVAQNDNKESNSDDENPYINVKIRNKFDRLRSSSNSSLLKSPVRTNRRTISESSTTNDPVELRDLPRKQEPKADNRKDLNQKVIAPFQRYLTQIIERNNVRKYLDNPPRHIKITEVANVPVDHTLSNLNRAKDITWRFRIMSEIDEKLYSVMLYDHNKNFKIGKISFCPDTKTSPKNLQLSYSYYHTGCIVEHAILPMQYLEINLHFAPKFGEYRVYIIFQLKESILLVKEVRIKVMEEEKQVEDVEEFTLEIEKTRKAIALLKPHQCVIWEPNYSIRQFPGNVLEMLQGEYKISIKVEEYIKDGTYEKIQDDFNADIYRTRFHNLLYLEEYEHRNKMLKYDLENFKITSETVSYTMMLHDSLHRAGDGYQYVKFNFKYHLFEGYQGFRPPKIAYIIPNNSNIAFECEPPSETFPGLDFMWFKVSDETIKACEMSNGLAMVRFSPDLKLYRIKHKVVDEIDLNIVFPTNRKLVPLQNKWNEKLLLERLEELQLSEDQKKAIYNICELKLQAIPTIISGPFGSGKTSTLIHAAKLITTALENSRILICCHNNHCANLHIEKLHELFQQEKMDIPMFRHVYKHRNIYSFKNWPIMKNYCLFDECLRTFEIPTKDYLQSRRVIVSTTESMFDLFELNLKEKDDNFFTHIFIDEAAEVIEPESCIPLAFAGGSTKIVMVGDIHQASPLVSSKFSKKFQLDRSLLERLHEDSCYLESPALSACKINLYENFRCPKIIGDFLSKLFYENNLVTHYKEMPKGPKFPPMSFVHVNGLEKQMPDSPSFVNEAEAHQVISYIEMFLEAGVDYKQITVLSTYNSQVKLIRFLAKKRRLPIIFITGFEAFQGLEADVVIVSTVRTLKDEDENCTVDDRIDYGIMDDIKQFNTILSRSRGWVMIIGYSYSLCNVGSCFNVWREYVDQCMELGGYFVDGKICKNNFEDDDKILRDIPFSKEEEAQIPDYNPEVHINPGKTHVPHELIVTQQKCIREYLEYLENEVSITVTNDPLFMDYINRQVELCRYQSEVIHQLESSLLQYSNYKHIQGIYNSVANVHSLPFPFHQQTNRHNQPMNLQSQGHHANMNQYNAQMNSHPGYMHSTNYNSNPQATQNYYVNNQPYANANNNNNNNNNNYTNSNNNNNSNRMMGVYNPISTHQQDHFPGPYSTNFQASGIGRGYMMKQAINNPPRNPQK